MFSRIFNIRIEDNEEDLDASQVDDVSLQYEAKALIATINAAIHKAEVKGEVSLMTTRANTLERSLMCLRRR